MDTCRPSCVGPWSRLNRIQLKGLCQVLVPANILWFINCKPNQEMIRPRMLKGTMGLYLGLSFFIYLIFSCVRLQSVCLIYFF